MSTVPWHQIQVATTFAMLGLIWTVQLVQYPGFRRVPRDAFARYHQHHCAAITWIVGPLMLGEAAAAVSLWRDAAGGPLQTAIVCCLAVAWLSTGLLQIPLHRRLARGWDEALIRRLVHSNWLRTAAWSTKAALVAGTLG
jgi:hypothetical protein